MKRPFKSLKTNTMSNMEQRSKEWFAHRLGRLTASRFGDVIAGRQTARHRNYVAKVADEIMGIPSFGDMNGSPSYFAYGADMEPKAKGLYSFRYDVEVIEVGSIEHPDLPFVSASPDGLIGNDGGCEIKCHLSPREAAACVHKMPMKHMPQVQGCMWVTNRKWWDFISFNEIDGINLHVHRIAADPAYHKKLFKACVETYAEVWREICHRLMKLESTDNPFLSQSLPDGLMTALSSFVKKCLPESPQFPRKLKTLITSKV
jgi:hypothetical protein